MQGWITGFESVKKIDLLKSALVQNREKKLFNLFGSASPSFHPIFSSFKYHDSDVLDCVKLIQARRDGSLLLFDKDYLLLVNKLYTEAADLGLLYPQKQTYSIFTDIMSSVPEALAEAREALSIINSCGGWISNMLTSVAYEIIPLKGANGELRSQNGFSDYNLLGSIFLGFYSGQQRVIDLAIAIVHELGHQVLMLQQAGQSPLEDGSFQKMIYSGVRKTERPAIAAFHAVIALTYMNEMYKQLLNTYHFDNASQKSYCEAMYTKNNSDLLDGLKAIDNVELTKVGERIIADVKSTLDN
jgi:hypothetical protein